MVTVGSIFGGRGMWIWYLIGHMKLTGSPLENGWHRFFKDVSVPTCFYLRRPSCPPRCLWGRHYLQGLPRIWQTASRWWYTWDLFHIKYFETNMPLLWIIGVSVDDLGASCDLKRLLWLETLLVSCQVPQGRGGRAQCRIPASLEFVIRQLLKSISLLCEGTQDFLKDLYASKLVNPLRYLNNVCFHGLKSRMNWRGKRSSLDLNGPKSWSLPSEPLCTGRVHRTWVEQCPSRPRPWSPFPPHPPPSPI